MVKCVKCTKTSREMRTKKGLLYVTNEVEVISMSNLTRVVKEITRLQKMKAIDRSHSFNKFGIKREKCKSLKCQTDE